ncbi:hypothetical protein H6P81_006871 [Aristolochia fimbriata]|uniref:CBM20 domain-containing protein n=1 Tax=Aristolochia fimbriata TaxID=158543 RepID=A0AAV7EYR3_ARIFI|nr:hypothetical protein H6P81_006871 [Aristolochia fimbriata]
MMEALAKNSPLRVFSDHLSGVPVLSGGKVPGLAIQTVRLPKLQTRVGGVIRHKALGSSSIACVSAASEVGLAIEQTEIQSTHGLSTVHVKFILQKECLFGEHFLLAGGDPIFGLWDPANAIPLQWSEEHIWIAELDISIDKSIEFKFIRKGPSGDIEWQPGPDRVLQTWETNKTIVVTEDWEKAELQVIREEEVVTEDTEKAELQVTREEETKNQSKEPTADEPRDVVLAESVVDDTKKSENNPISLKKEENPATTNEEAAVESPITVNEEIPVLVPGLNESPITINEEIPILVSGLNPSPMAHSAPGEFCSKESMDEESEEAFLATEEANSQMASKKHESSTYMVDEPKVIDGTPPAQFKDHDSSPIEGVSGDALDRNSHSVEISQEAPDTDSVFGNDIQWGRKILSKLIMGMGFDNNQLN